MTYSTRPGSRCCHRCGRSATSYMFEEIAGEVVQLCLDCAGEAREAGWEGGACAHRAS